MKSTVSFASVGPVSVSDILSHVRSCRQTNKQTNRICSVQRRVGVKRTKQSVCGSVRCNSVRVNKHPRDTEVGR